ncbi:amidohydrolase family protein [Elongatibacter sediminis]|uniref:Amidohydrolase family protein n=1 Tax=Elongatibacter sediminis TaxID=3119006 RepID=A0AAW9RH60_9GAMM
MKHGAAGMARVLTLAVSLVMSFLLAPAQAADLAITGATLIDGTGSAPVRDAVVVIDDGRISAAGPRTDVRIPQNAEVIDATGRYLIPGLMDANLHLYLNRDLETLIKYEGRYHEIIIEAAQIALKTGLTTVFDTWGPRAPLVRARDAINAGEVPGARIYLAGNIIGYGGIFSTDFNAPAAQFVSRAFARRLDEMWEQGTGQDLLWAEPEKVRAAVREYTSLDVDFLKYGASGHALHEMRFISFSPRVQRIIIEEGHRAGLIVQAHTSTTESLDLAIEAGVDILTHCDVSGADTVLSDETIAKIAERGIPCSVIPVTQRRLEAMNAVDSDHWLPRYTANMKENQRRMIAAGVTLLVSTDAGITHPVLASEATGIGAVRVDPRTTLGEGHFNALVGLEELGMDPMAVLQAATRNIAVAYHKEQELGTIEPGKRADLVILDHDPLEDARHYRSIATVIKDGEVVAIEGLPVAPLISSQEVE